jgi:hypothetical protein
MSNNKGVQMGSYQKYALVLIFLFLLPLLACSKNSTQGGSDDSDSFDSSSAGSTDHVSSDLSDTSSSPISTDSATTDTQPPQGCDDSPCDFNATCTEENKNVSCECNVGWQGDGYSCQDIDECELGIDDCDSINGTCTNTQGSYTCGCNIGYHLDSDSKTCLQDTACTNGDTRSGSTTCGLNNRGYFQQECLGGTWQNTSDCIDPDSCEDGDTRTSSTVCGNNGTLEERCLQGQWQNTTNCLNEDTIVDTDSTDTSASWPQCFAGDAMPENPNLQVDPDASGYVHALSDNNYVVMLIGPDRPACITDEVALDRTNDLDTGLRAVVEVVGFPAFPEWAQGYYLNWVILNSGIPGATIPAEGGHQGYRWGHMNFESTQTCPCVWDDYQSGGALHECVHALLAELWVFNNPASGWIHEAYNNYLTTMANGLVHGRHSIGGAITLMLQMPHVPIESMGLFTNGVIAGPSDQLASNNTYISTQVRYAGEIFFLSMAQTMGRGFGNCMWMDTPASNQKSVFQIMAGYGDEAVSTALMSFAAKSSILDFEEWTPSVRQLMQGRWRENWWFYTFPESGDGTTSFRPPLANIPHHQGRNTIPIQLKDGATSVTVEFLPDETGSAGTSPKMQAQLVYRDSDDTPVYGEVFSSGQSTIEITNGARNGIVNLAIAVVHPNGDGPGDDNSGKGFDGQEHFGYQARIVSGGTIAPTSTRPW